MIGLLFTLAPFILIIYYWCLRKKRQDILFDIKYGLRCYSCKERIDISKEIESDNVNVKACVSCEREDKLEKLFLPNIIRANVIKKIIISKAKKIDIIMLCLVASSCIFDIFMTIAFHIHGFGIISNISNVLFWTILIIRLKITTIKNPK